MLFKKNRNIHLPVSALILLLGPVLQAQGQESFVIGDIRVEGLQRIAPVTVFGALPVSVGDTISPEIVPDIVRSIFATDNFQDVVVLQEDNVLIIRLEERPVISAIDIDGNSLIPTDALTENMEGAGIAVGQPYKPSVVTGMQLAIEDQYIGQGMYGANVEVDLEEQDRNRVALSINITEGDAAKITHINIVGNTTFDKEELLDLFELRETHFTSFFRKDDRYSREKINGDLERLGSYYMDRGYVNFDILSTQVSVNPDRDEVYITINISEGEVYKINEVQLAGDLVDMEDIMRLVLQVREGQTFSQQLVTTSSEFLTQLLNNRGYFFAEVEGIPRINEADQSVDVTFFVEPGNRTYVNRINYQGNTNSIDEVLRREMRQMEGAPASSVALEQSKLRLERLGYFREVQYETSEVPGTTDQINVDFTVEEQLSGSIGGSIGYAQVQGLVLSANLQQNNFLGTGTQVGIGVNTSRFQTSYNFSFFDPYYTVDGVSRGFSLSYAESDYARLNLASYSTNRIAASVNYGYMISESESLSFNFGINQTELEASSFAVKEIKTSPILNPNIDRYFVRPPRLEPYTNPETGEVFPVADAVTAPITDLPSTAFNSASGFIDRNGTDFTSVTVGLSLNRSTLNRGIFPTAGSARQASIEVSVPGSDLEYWKLRFFTERYIPVFPGWIAHGKLEVGYGEGYGDDDELPFFLNFYAGGLGTIRGFERNTLGPRSTFPQIYTVPDQGTRLLRDPDTGEVVYNAEGVAVLDTRSPSAYLLDVARDENGDVLIAEDGLPVYEDRISRTDRFSGRPAAFGGNIQVTGTLEMIFPMPFIEQNQQVRSSLFVDMGNVFSSYCTEQQKQLNNCNNFTFSEFRYSAGISVTWLSGFGPMSFSLAQPFNNTEIDETEVFQFTIGNTF